MKVKSNQCQTCKHFDREQSNDNWTVCPKITVTMILELKSKGCPLYEEALHV